jgi:uncharacterized protein
MKYSRVMTDTQSYLEFASVVEVSGWQIPAALTLPQGLGETAVVPSAILLVPGSLFCDVNGDFPTWNSFPRVYAHLAQQLSALGHVVYRFAKLGPGTGSVATNPDLAAVVRTWDGRVTIALAALDAMHGELKARGIRAERTVGAGHSEGSVVVSRLAASDRGKEIDAVVLLAGPSVGILEIMREQSGSMTPVDQRDEAARALDEVIVYVRRGERPPAELGAGQHFGAGALVNMPYEALRYMRETDATDPVAVARALSQPTLVVQGGKDSSVPVHHGERLRDALCERANGRESTDYLFVPEVSHMFKVVPEDVVGPAAFGYPGPIDARVTDGIDRWVRGLIG